MSLRWLLAACLGLSAAPLPAAAPPEAEITNGQVRVKLYLPDAERGFYRGTRFDWAGVIHSLEYKGHNFYGPWFDRVDPSVRDFVYEQDRIVASPCTAITGPAEEFQPNLGWDQAKPGGTFVKIGVGVLRKNQERYDPFHLYPIADPGRWTVRQSKDSIEFTQQVSDPVSGYGYVYRKTVRLTPGKAQMVLEHSLRNTGSRTIRNNVYNHNFLVLDRQPTGPDFFLEVPFLIKSSTPPEKALAAVRGNRLSFLRTLEPKERVMMSIEGFSASPKDYDFRIENTAAGAGVRIRADRPLARAMLWAIRPVQSVEPFIAVVAEPGGEFTWTIIYEYFAK
jgi:hypothetical protein